MMNLVDAASAIVFACEENGFTDLETMQVLCFAEESGEFVGAYRRWKGLARRTGDFNEMAKELADVRISTQVVAQILNIPLDRYVESKLEVIFTRGWNDRLAK